MALYDWNHNGKKDIQDYDDFDGYEDAEGYYDEAMEE